MKTIITTIRRIMANNPTGFSIEAPAHNPELFGSGTERLRTFTR